MKSGRFICFEGLDGSGKSSAAALTAGRLAAAGEDVRFLRRKDPDAGDPALRGRLELLADLIWSYGETPIERFGDEHALFNVASWFSAIDRVRVRPLLAAGVSVVIDNWYFKFLARMQLKPALDPQLADLVFAHLSQPDEVVFLDVTPEAAADRKGSFTRGEAGGFDGYGRSSRENFTRYQAAVRPHLLKLAADHGWFAIDVDGHDLDGVVAVAAEHLLDGVTR